MLRRARAGVAKIRQFVLMNKLLLSVLTHTMQNPVEAFHGSFIYGLIEYYDGFLQLKKLACPTAIYWSSSQKARLLAMSKPKIRLILSLTISINLHQLKDDAVVELLPFVRML